MFFSPCDSQTFRGQKWAQGSPQTPLPLQYANTTATAIRTASSSQTSTSSWFWAKAASAKWGSFRETYKNNHCLLCSSFVFLFVSRWCWQKGKAQMSYTPSKSWRKTWSSKMTMWSAPWWRREFSLWLESLLSSLSCTRVSKPWYGKYKRFSEWKWWNS